MPRTSKHQVSFLTLPLQSSHPDGLLKHIEIIGIPSKTINGREVLNDSVLSFFDDSIGRPIFAKARRIPHLKWKKLKIWLSSTDEELEYSIPDINDLDLKIESNISESNLEQIYILDNELNDNEYWQWKRDAEATFTPLFKKFVPPPQLPIPLPFSPFIESLDTKLDPYAKMKRELFFDTLIIQID